MDGSPYRKDKHGNVVDRRNTRIAMFPAAEAALRELLTWEDVVIAAASRTEYPEWADEVLRLMTIDGKPLHEVFTLKEIYPSSKRRHFKKLTEDSGIPYEDMLFFDDMMMNITEVCIVLFAVVVIDVSACCVACALIHSCSWADLAAGRDLPVLPLRHDAGGVGGGPRCVRAEEELVSLAI